MRIHVVFATTGRAELIKQIVGHLARQSRPADGVLIVGAQKADIGDSDDFPEFAKRMIAPKGLCKQRNAALAYLRGRADVVLFLDDDFVPADDYLENLHRLMEADPALAGLTGILIADGAQTRPVRFEEAVAMIEERGKPLKEESRQCSSLYGCNMAIRLSAAEGLNFDESLPLYGWQEDVDFTYQLSWRGKLLRTSELTGVHMGFRGGKTSGRRLGYSQIANVVYLWRKGTMCPWLGERLLLQNIISNIVRSLWPEPDIDRRGRMAGNILALVDLLRGRIDPRRIEGL